jgi:large subunit ribosomal protein L30
MAKSTGNKADKGAAAASGTVKVRLVKGLRGTRAVHRLSVKALGLNKLNDVRELKDSPQVRGLINTVHYLVRVEG